MLWTGCSARSLLGSDTAQSDKNGKSSMSNDLAKVFSLQDPDVLKRYDPSVMVANKTAIMEV